MCVLESDTNPNFLCCFLAETKPTKVLDKGSPPEALCRGSFPESEAECLLEGGLHDFRWRCVRGDT